LVLLAAIIAWRGGGIFGGDGTTSLRDVLNPLSLFDERSPGDRADGSLLAAKRGKGRGVSPVELVMSTGRQRAPPVSEAVAPAAAPESLFATPAEGPLAASDVPESGIPGEAILGSPQGPPAGLGGPGFIIPIGTVPGVSGPPTTPPSTPPCCVGQPPGGPGPIPPPIPEPATWMMMIMGFFMVGAALRARCGAAVAIARSDPGRG
jgi:hypothetical protein